MSKQEVEVKYKTIKFETTTKELDVPDDWDDMRKCRLFESLKARNNLEGWMTRVLNDRTTAAIGEYNGKIQITDKRIPAELHDYS